MSMQSVSMFVIIVLAVVLSWKYFTVTGLNVNLLEYSCNVYSHGTNSNGEKACNELFKYIHKHAADPGYIIQKNLKIGDVTYYGHGACSGNINQGECTRCIGAAQDWAVELCSFSNGVHVKLGDCRFRVENYPFEPSW